MSRLTRRLLLSALVLAVLLSGTAAIAVSRGPSLSAVGPVEVGGVESSGVFRIGDRQIRQVRYTDRETLTYEFTVRNDGLLDVTVNGLAPVRRESTLLRLGRVHGSDGRSEVEVPARSSRRLVLDVLMTDCERLSARASSLVESLPLEVSALGRTHRIEVELPEELRTGSAREMFCPLATAKSRPPG